MKDKDKSFLSNLPTTMVEPIKALCKTMLDRGHEEATSKIVFSDSDSSEGWRISVSIEKIPPAKQATVHYLSERRRDL